MNKLYELIKSEYRIEYIDGYTKSEGRMNKPKFSTPKIISEKRLSAFSENEKKEILQKHKRWYVYYYFRNKEGKMVKQPSIFFKVNQENKDFDSRYLKIHKLRKALENILNQGFLPYHDDDNSIIQDDTPIYTANSAIDFALSIKQNIASDKTFSDYKYRIKQFQKWLKVKNLEDIPISEISKKDINEFLNFILTKSSPTNRNNILLYINV